MNWSFEIDVTAVWVALAFGALFVFFFRWTRQFSPPLIRFSDLKTLLMDSGAPGRSAIPALLGYAALLLFMLAFIDPHFFVEKAPEKEEEQKLPEAEAPVPTEGIAIYLVLDQSGSMAGSVRGMSPKGYMTMIPKIDLLRYVTTDFIRGNKAAGLAGRPNDLIGIVSFARTAHVMAPLTLDHQALLDQMAKFDVVKQQDEDNTAIGYAIYKTVNIIAATRHFSQDLAGKGKPAYTIKSSAIILVTDGFQDPSLLDKGNDLRNMSPMEAAKYAKKEGIHLYIINVEPSMAKEEFGPQRRLLERAAALTGGKFFLAGGDTGLAQIYAEINQLEKSVLPEESRAKTPRRLQPHLYNRISLYPWLIAMGMLALLFSVLLDTTALRRFP